MISAMLCVLIGGALCYAGVRQGLWWGAVIGALIMLVPVFRLIGAFLDTGGSGKTPARRKKQPAGRSGKKEKDDPYSFDNLLFYDTFIDDDDDDDD